MEGSSLRGVPAGTSGIVVPLGKTKTGNPPAAEPVTCEGVCAEYCLDYYVPSPKREQEKTVMPEGMGALRADIKTKLDKFVELAESLDGSLEKEDAFLKSVINLREEIKTLSPQLRAILVPMLRDRFYDYLRAGDFVKAGLVMAAFEDTPELNRDHFLPRNEEGTTLLRKMSVRMMRFKATLFKKEYVDSQNFRFGYEDGNVSVDGDNPNKKLNCISFALLFMMKVLGAGELKKEGKRELAHLGGKTGPDLADMFAVSVPGTQTFDNQGQLIKDMLAVIVKDVKKDGAAFYVCQAYRIDVETKKPEAAHSFIVVAVPDKKDNEVFYVNVLESNPPQPRDVEFVEKMEANSYVKITMRSLVPTEPAGQLSLFRAGAEGANLPKGKKAL